MVQLAPASYRNYNEAIGELVPLVAKREFNVGLPCFRRCRPHFYRLICTPKKFIELPKCFARF